MQPAVGRAARRCRLSLATQMLIVQLVILAITVGAGAAVTVYRARQQLDRYHGQRCLAIAESVAAMPAIRHAFDDPKPSATIQPIAEAVRQASEATFVVVANNRGIRHAHPDPWKIGRPLSTDPSPALAGHTYIGVQTGTLGRSVRAKVPIYGDEGTILGLVSVGILTEHVVEQLWRNVPDILIYLSGALLLGASAAALLARRVKRQTFGLEPAEIGRLVEQREAMLEGIREGVIGFDDQRRVTLVNDEARRLLDLPQRCLGRELTELQLPDRLVDVLSGAAHDPDEVVLRRGRVLALNWMPVRVRGEDTGTVITLRDRTELDTLTRELDGARSTTDALRAQGHEFFNKLHTVAGLLELEEYDEAKQFLSRTTAAHERLADQVSGRISEPALAALLVAKSAAAAERGAELRIAEGTRFCAGDDPDVSALLTVVGNLTDNALEALDTAGGWVEVLVRRGDDGTLVRVRDSGPGVAPELAREVFSQGFTTKVARSAGSRGLGLALTRQACIRRGGWADVHNEEGAVFTAFLPHARTEAPSGDGADEPVGSGVGA
ncbi:two-component system CitB family sensor kinase [Halopolyspora algeriensis]|uniref:Two-component system CitB family sensor kinase n=1 Tax=Halopolyspora algeriensis TaxID=1500506 RepID=A0A368VP63_9ACTN|nr:sensor histidine kinase [Halopolyspora algeriensis]RCW40930.1 two-component system CitB family sensor kinase [Halopolyspora algeriensis]TQM53984.1 two-component system CitB family sensor kinase [Halopolyspora algeriensis]